MIKPPPLRPNIWYHRDDCLKLALEPGEAEITPMKYDTFIIKEIGDQRYDALVPTHSMGENLSYVPVDYAGKTADGRIIFHLPTSNEGRPTWVIPEHYLEQDGTMLNVTPRNLEVAMPFPAAAVAAAQSYANGNKALADAIVPAFACVKKTNSLSPPPDGLSDAEQEQWNYLQLRLRHECKALRRRTPGSNQYRRSAKRIASKTRGISSLLNRSANVLAGDANTARAA